MLFLRILFAKSPWNRHTLLNFFLLNTFVGASSFSEQRRYSAQSGVVNTVCGHSVPVDIEKHQTRVLATFFEEISTVYAAAYCLGQPPCSLPMSTREWVRERRKKKKRLSWGNLLTSLRLETFLRINSDSLIHIHFVSYCHGYISFYEYSIYNGKLQDGSILHEVYFYNLKNKCRPDNLEQHCGNILGYLGRSTF